MRGFVVLSVSAPVAFAAAQMPVLINVTPCGPADSLFHTTSGETPPKP